MIENAKVEAAITAEVEMIELMLASTQEILDLGHEHHSSGLDHFQTIQDRIVERLAAFPAAVMVHGPFKDSRAVRAALEQEVRFVVAALDGGH
jgi:hypothetical protein